MVTTIPWEKYYYPHLNDEEMEAEFIDYGQRLGSVESGSVLAQALDLLRSKFLLIMLHYFPLSMANGE